MNTTELLNLRREIESFSRDILYKNIDLTTQEGKDIFYKLMEENPIQDRSRLFSKDEIEKNKKKDYYYNQFNKYEPFI